MVNQSRPQAPDLVQVAQDADWALVRVRGCASFRTGPALKRFGLSALEHGARRVVVDLASCVSVDSTFMGVLAGLAMRMARGGGGSLSLAGARPEVAARFRALGLQRVIDIDGTGATPPDPPPDSFRDLDCGEEERNPRTKLHTSVTAHEDLLNLSAENEPKFRDVLAVMREELMRVEGASGSEAGRYAG
jgi:anti-sigma B factor antagonist